MLKVTLLTPPISDKTSAPVLNLIVPLSLTKNLSVSEPAFEMLPSDIANDTESSDAFTVAVMVELVLKIKV